MNTNDVILVTGANGFVGRGLFNMLRHRKCPFRATARNRIEGMIPTGSISESTDWSAILQGVHTVAHTAAIVHKTNAKVRPDEYDVVNVQGTTNLAAQAAKAGVRRFVFISTIGVLGPSSQAGHPLCEASPFNPTNYYTDSKLRAEFALQNICLDNGMEFAIIRPPMIYGRNAKGSLRQLVHLVEKGVPLPFAAVNNRRNIISLENTVQALMACITQDNAANRVFVVAEKEAVSTAQIVEAIVDGLRIRNRQFSFPPSLLRIMLKAVGGTRFAEGLCGSLEISSEVIEKTLGWRQIGTTLENLRSDFSIGKDGAVW